MALYKPVNTWGCSLWQYIHSICVIGGTEYDINKHSLKTIEILHNLKGIIPCEFCATHYETLCLKTPPMFSGKPLELFQWSVNLHNEVNIFLGKPTWTLQQATERWIIQSSQV